MCSNVGYLDSTQAVAHSVLELGNSVGVGAAHKDGAGEWVLDLVNDGVLGLAQCLLPHLAGKAEHLG